MRADEAQEGRDVLRGSGFDRRVDVRDYVSGEGVAHDGGREHDGGDFDVDVALGHSPCLEPADVGGDGVMDVVAPAAGELVSLRALIHLGHPVQEKSPPEREPAANVVEYLD